ncbi:hypothetical protein AXF42_Ash017897 [Apostasia shenzhenica]|uniref:Uncharacterized protein n=1 Tax=Apostasia shenzhenica TaxID=1088818 RepID=A0A2I0AY65_9ASPA|nr:hypothetical protein AXF42_Ash017897 [Apostasia shenzhenica]
MISSNGSCWRKRSLSWAINLLRSLGSASRAISGGRSRSMESLVTGVESISTVPSNRLPASPKSSLPLLPLIRSFGTASVR